MAKINDARKAAMAKVDARRSRPSMARMQQVKSAATGNPSSARNRSSGASKSKKASAPKVVGRRSAKPAQKSLAKPTGMSRVKGNSPAVARMRLFDEVAQGYRKARPSRYRSGKGGVAKIVPVPGRHIAPNMRYKTGYWRITRSPWMSDAVWSFIKAMHRNPEKWMDKGMKKASIQPKVYGKTGPGHAGYGSGELQKWSDYILHQNKGLDPHQVDLMHWFKGAAGAMDYFFGKKDFDTLMKDAKGNPDHAMRVMLERLQSMMPEMKRLSKRDIQEIMKHKHYTISYGPDGRAK